MRVQAFLETACSPLQEPALRRIAARTQTAIKLDPERPEYHRASLSWHRSAAHPACVSLDAFHPCIPCFLTDSVKGWETWSTSITSSCVPV